MARALLPMNQKQERCFCGVLLVRVQIHTNKGWDVIGYYCPTCKVQLGLDLIPLVSYKTVYHIEQDPTLGIILDLFPQDWRKVITKMFEIKIRAKEMTEAVANQPES